jgi:hypothetical protein
MYYKKNGEFLAKKETSIAIKKVKDSLDSKLFMANLITIEHNQMALDYFENKTTGHYLEANQVRDMVQNSLYEYNENKNVNQLIDIENMSEKPFLFDTFRLINHRWMVADFTDGKYSGEVFLKYFIEKNNTVSFEQVQTVLFN